MEPVQLAKLARESLVAALNAIQSSEDAPDELFDMAEPIAQTITILRKIERSGGAMLDGRDVALKNVRKILTDVQNIEGDHPSADEVLEAVAGSLAKVNSLAKWKGPGQTSIPPPCPSAPPPQSSAPPPKSSAPPPKSSAPPPRPSAPPPAIIPKPAPVPAIAPRAEQSPSPRPVAAVHPADEPRQALDARIISEPHPVVQPRPIVSVQPEPVPVPQPVIAPKPVVAVPAPQPVVQAKPVESKPQPTSQPTSQAAAAPSSPAPAKPDSKPPPAPAAPVVTAPAPEPKSAPKKVPAPPAPPGVKTVDVSLGTRSVSNFYRGLGGNDVIDHGGVFVETYQILKIGTQVQLHVHMPGDYEFYALATVMWTRETGGSSEPGFGARFTQIGNDGRQLVYRYSRIREPMFYDDL